MIDQQIENGDLSLLSTIPSQTTDLDKRSLLALHAAVRAQVPDFTYLEIGSHLGGSLQALVADPKCKSIISIDPRPTAFKDERGIVSRYPGNSTAKMLELLKTVPHASVTKIHTIDSDSSKITPAEIPSKPDFCFIDGEHTDVAALRDARFCLKVMREDGCIAFHDANVVFAGIHEFLNDLSSAGREFRAYLLPDAVFVVEIGKLRLKETASVAASLEQAWRGYMFGLEMNLWYRAVLNKPLFKMLRRIKFVRRIFIVKGLGAQPI